jgi:hypothetical protein
MGYHDDLNMCQDGERTIVVRKKLGTPKSRLDGNTEMDAGAIGCEVRSWREPALDLSSLGSGYLRR